jgi:hypothetical protein
MSDTSTLSLLTALYGGGSSGSAVSSDPVAALSFAQRTQTSQIALEAKQPDVSRAIAKFTAALAGAKDPASLLKNPYVLDVLLTVNGLGDQAAYPALAQKALLSNTTDPKALANQLPNTNWKSAAQTYDFANKGLSVLQTPSVLATIAQAYAEVKWRQSLDATTPGLSNALSFIDTAKKATSVDAVLGDATLRTVVTTALGIPPQIAFQDIGAQEQAISLRLDIGQLKDPKFVQNMARLYLIQTQIANAGNVASGPSLEQLAVSSAGLVV